ncbi:PAS domain-containing protein [Haloarcula onubensis]|uniref:PAS domain-containing protein n=1 Tax=Haloarcula onubensis TaxID=2950539 RepID=A0ABU2FJP9_9EURY|nr:PAS domain-containing protein [Halomicroarcula sp. S3CR25-11]MDS0280985.1 PAS domain-containing protein [Halomicroarcula sp. S3CR25-11]
MSTRASLRELLTCEESAFPSAARSFLAAHDGDPDRVGRAEGDLPTLVDLPQSAVASLSAHERALLRRVWVLDDAPLGITLAGPVYQDNPVVYVNRTFRALTGYSLSAVRGENLRLLQGPDTEPDTVDALSEAVAIWEPVTVALWNYRADGSRFRNRVSLVPTRDEDGMLANWVGLQERVDG